MKSPMLVLLLRAGLDDAGPDAGPVPGQNRAFARTLFHRRARLVNHKRQDLALMRASVVASRKLARSLYARRLKREPLIFWLR